MFYRDAKYACYPVNASHFHSDPEYLRFTSSPFFDLVYTDKPFNMQKKSGNVVPEDRFSFSDMTKFAGVWIERF